MPACTSIGHPEQAEQQERDRPRRDREMREAERRADQRDRADEPGDADTDGEELEDDERESDDEQEVRHPGRVERVRELGDETELAEVHLAFGLADLPAVELDDLDRRRLHRTGRRLQTCGRRAAR